MAMAIAMAIRAKAAGGRKQEAGPSAPTPVLRRWIPAFAGMTKRNNPGES
jgi:hypothetical protein